MIKLMTFVGILVGWLFSLCLHEFAHAYLAYRGGDYSVKSKGYFTFNPLAYTNLTSSIIFPLIIMAIGGIALPGGAVYIEKDRLRSQRWESAVSLAGPCSNFLLAIILSIPFRLKLYSFTPFWAGYAFFVYIQVFATLLNLLPLPPLDGYGAIEPWLSWRTRLRLQPVKAYGFMILIFLFIFVEPFQNFFHFIITSIVVKGLGVNRELIGVGYANFIIL